MFRLQGFHQPRVMEKMTWRFNFSNTFGTIVLCDPTEVLEVTELLCSKRALEVK